jgi:hypothetical protein
MQILLRLLAYREREPKNSYYYAMPRVAKTKNGFAPKVCMRCGLEFEWRKKWAKDWAEVKYCSDRCRENK